MTAAPPAAIVTSICPTPPHAPHPPPAATPPALLFGTGRAHAWRARPPSCERPLSAGSTIVSYILPGLCYFILFPDRSSRWLGFIVLCLGLCIMPTSLYLIFFARK